MTWEKQAAAGRVRVTMIRGIVAVVQLLLLSLVVTGMMLSRVRRLDLIGETQEYPLAFISTHPHPQHSSLVPADLSSNIRTAVEIQALRSKTTRQKKNRSYVRTYVRK